VNKQLKIGIFLAGALGILAAFIFVVGDMSELFRERGYTLNLVMDSALGLENSSSVKMAGIKIGIVKDIVLQERRAQVVMNIYPRFKVPKGSKGTLASLGLLGERFIEITPGTEKTYYQPGESLEGKDSISFDQIGAQAISVGEEIKKLSGDLRSFLGRDSGENLRQTLENLAAVTAQMDKFLAANKEDIGKTFREAGRTIESVGRDFQEASANFNKAVSGIGAVAEDNRESVRTNMEKIKEILSKIEAAVDRLNRSLEKIDKGEGSVGKLVNDEGLYDEIKGTIRSVGRIAGPLSSLRANVELRGDYYTDSRRVKGALSLDLQAGKKAYVSGGIVHDPWRDRFVYSLQGGARWGGFVPRAGIIESEFGAGLDFYALGDRLALGVEAFDFNRNPRPRFRAFGKFYPVKNLFLVAGVDDFTLSPQREFFIGLGVGTR
jgi:phospholipid/cholesterol/gamma-HCH transport system substrate-binding protein